MDLVAADASLDAISDAVQSTFNASVVSVFGGFGGVVRVPSHIERPVVVSSIDSVGTKVSVAVQAGRLDTVGYDIVHHCVNDILVTGATPLCFMDYFAHADLTAAQTAEAIRGVAAACKALDVPLVSGETAQLPGVYRDREFDLVGAVIGVASEDDLLNSRNVRPGDVVVALPSRPLLLRLY